MMDVKYSDSVLQATNQQREMIISLLKSENLPANDLPDSLDHFFIALDASKVVGVVGLEYYEHDGLLRSLVVDERYRKQNIASILIQRLEQHAKSNGVNAVYLLTETAREYFEYKGYQVIGREQVPRLVKSSSEFTYVCPISAIAMKKNL